jgi:hypothetical protein
MELYQSRKSRIKGHRLAGCMRINGKKIKQNGPDAFAVLSTLTALQKTVTKNLTATMDDCCCCIFACGRRCLECFFFKGLIEVSQIFAGLYIYFSITVSGKSGTCFELLLVKLLI